MSAISECFDHILRDHRTKGHATLISAAMVEITKLVAERDSWKSGYSEAKSYHLSREGELIKRIATLEEECDEWKKRAEQAAHIKEDDAVGFDWNVLTQIESLEAVAEAARAGLHPFCNGDDNCSCHECVLKRAVDALDALKGAE